MKKTLVTLITLTICFGVTTAEAKQTPNKLSSDQRIEVVPYSTDNVIPIYGSTFTTTQVIFDKNEYIENIQNGDLSAWTVSVNKNLPYMLFIKPTVKNSNTNMTVITNKHSYYFHLIAQGEHHKKTYALKFIYPNERRKKIESAILKREQQKQTELSAAKNPSEYNWNYSFNGDKSIMPVHVFDDGQFTYFQLRPGQPVPAVFAVNDQSGKEAVVNYRQDKHYLVIQRTAPQFTLRLGKTHVASIFNNKLIKKENS